MCYLPRGSSRINLYLPCLALPSRALTVPTGDFVCYGDLERATVKYQSGWSAHNTSVVIQCFFRELAFLRMQYKTDDERVPNHLVRPAGDLSSWYEDQKNAWSWYSTVDVRDSPSENWTSELLCIGHNEDTVI
jgi:hypothetical protein